MRRVVVQSLEPDPDNAGVGMRIVGFLFCCISTPVGYAVFIFLKFILKEGRK